MPTPIPDHPEAAAHLRTVRELAALGDQISDLQRQRHSLMQSLPCGFYTLPDAGRFKVELVRSSHISTRELSLWVSPEVIKRCRVHGRYRKQFRPAPMADKQVNHR